MTVIEFLRKDQLFSAIASLALAAMFYAGFIEAPFAYPEGTIVTVKSGQSVSEAAVLLREKNALHSPLAFTFLVSVMGRSGVIAGTYALDVRENAVSLAYRLSNGETGIDSVRVTLPEGLNSREIGNALSKVLGDFDATAFAQVAKGSEGYLFPDTYYFLPGTPPEIIIDVMKKNFNERVQPYEGEIQGSGKSLAEIITMASILEKEARKPETMKIVSGILWKRVEKGMALQVDAVFGYILDKSGYGPSFDDLKIDSPYNTYTNRGLPQGPISNPGLNSIEAALRPTDSPYWYYLTGRDGKMYYAKTFEQHVANRSKLR
jgi:UPF0755 protein